MRNVATGRAPRPQPTQAEIEAAERELVDATAELDGLMLRAHDVKLDTATARRAVADALTDWMRGTPRVRHEHLARQAIADGIEQRRAKANGETPPPPPSTIRLNPVDCVGLRDNSSEGFARKGMQVGHSRQFVGGQRVYPASARGGKIETVKDVSGNVIGRRLVGPA